MRSFARALAPLASRRYLASVPTVRTGCRWHWPIVGGLAVASAYGSTQLECKQKQEERLVMAADCGGTTTRLMLYSVDPLAEITPQQQAPGTLVYTQEYPNILFKNLNDIVKKFLNEDCPNSPKPEVAVLALAGIVVNNQCRFTNLDWVVDGRELQTAHGIARVELINDFVAQGYGMLTLGEDEYAPLNDVAPHKGAPIACIGAGTGLGQCFLVADHLGDYHCYPSEGGHGEFGPRGAGSDDLQVELLKYLKIKFAGWHRVSVERVVSGRGICNIYDFLAHRSPFEVNKAVHKQHLQHPMDASIIAKNAHPGSLCEKAMQVFASCYGAQCGTFALTVQPFGGLYLTGGVTKRLANFLVQDGSFMESYLDKGRLTPLLEQIPIFLVKGDDMGKRGAHLRAVKLLQQHVEGAQDRLDWHDHEGMTKSKLVGPTIRPLDPDQLAAVVRSYVESSQKEKSA